MSMRRVNLFVPVDLTDGLKKLKVRDGVTESESIRRAIAAYLAEKGVATKKEKKGKK